MYSKKRSSKSSSKPTEGKVDGEHALNTLTYDTNAYKYLKNERRTGKIVD